VTDGDKVIATLRPERRFYTVRSMPMTEVAIDRGVMRDLYVALGEPVSATAWSVRLHHKPLVNWIWFGCLLMALGGLLAVLDRRYRSVKVAAKKSAPAIEPAMPLPTSLAPPVAAKVQA
jgi:cytochrome c-type biogenesis protein CcmF